ncbi:NTP transferase domain-containing protein [Gordonia sp. 'Campus']|uniref:nucleotidyltransferase family protein n=1 Tax=Gordonia sp. 'Campus' TaxID=2915824 RepID=UPI001EE421B5|nr:NTP transferase domain-containing protein [Gordonia sp. 'Campus']
MSEPTETTRADRILGVVLAAGAGTRYGMPKILAHGGEWLEHAVVSLRDGGCDDVVVAMGAAVVDPPAGARALIVDRWADGVGTTVAEALREAREHPDVAGVVLHVVDTPGVGADVVARVVAAGQCRRDGLARAVFDGRPGHPVYLGADHLDPALDVLTGDRGAQIYLRDRNVAVIECGDLASGHDIDNNIDDDIDDDTHERPTPD